jgi:hypothetical protein
MSQDYDLLGYLSQIVQQSAHLQIVVVLLASQTQRDLGLATGISPCHAEP